MVATAQLPARSPAAELKALLAASGVPAIASSGIGLWLAMVRVPPSGTWERRQADLYGLADEWVGRKEVSEGAGLQLLVRRYRDDDGRVLFDLPRAALPDPSIRAPVRFLQTFEALLMIHARRTQVMPEQYRPVVFNTRTPHSMPVFLVDGAVAGTWRYQGDRVVMKPFESIPRSVRRELDEEAKALAGFHAG